MTALRRGVPILLASGLLAAAAQLYAADLTVPVGTRIRVRMQKSLSSETAKVEDTFTATSLAPVRVAGQIAIPAGTVFHGVVAGVKKAGHLDRNSSLTLTFDAVTVRGQRQTVHGTVASLESGGYKKDAGKIGVGAGAGAVIGGLLGGGKGLIAGALIGSGGTLAASTGKDIELPAGTVIVMRVDQPITVPAPRPPAIR